MKYSFKGNSAIVSGGGSGIGEATARLLAANGVIGERDEMDAKTLPKVRMPNRDGFVGIDAKWPR